VSGSVLSILAEFSQISPIKAKNRPDIFSFEICIGSRTSNREIGRFLNLAIFDLNSTGHVGVERDRESL
jgi:hypothetical protein